MILSLEPMESLRYLRFLAPDGTLVTSVNPVRNIPDYPDLSALLEQVQDPAIAEHRAHAQGDEGDHGTKHPGLPACGRLASRPFVT